MTRHLTPEELIDALDTPGEPSGHLATCETCQRTIQDLGSVLGAVSAVDVPDPPPLFWDHLTTRIEQATTGRDAAPPRPWFVRGRNTLLAAGVAATVAASLTLVFGVMPPAASRDRAVTSTSTSTPSEDGAISPDEDSLAAVEALLAGLSLEDVQAVAAAVPEATLMDDLDADERTAFVRLVDERMETMQ
jgi:hypothetical protein